MPLPKKIYRLIQYLIIVMLLLAAPAYAEDLTLYWNPVASDLIVGYKIRISFKSRYELQDSYANHKIVINAHNQTSYTISNIELFNVDTLFLSLTCYDKYGTEGPYSAELIVSLSAGTTTTSSLTTTTSSIPGDGGAGNSSTTTSSVSSGITSTSTTSVRHCTSDADCDDAVFCNGQETCVYGRCFEGDSPCASDKMCMEDLQECWDVETQQAASIAQLSRIRRPAILLSKRNWLVLYCEEYTNFNPERSIIYCTGPDRNAAGIQVSKDRRPFGFGKFLFIPITVGRTARLGAWTVNIETALTGESWKYVEKIVGYFTLE